jgi:hypothetical protein
MITNPNPRFLIDGTMPDDTLGSVSDPDAIAPFYVFDTLKQHNVAGPFEDWREALSALTEAWDSVHRVFLTQAIKQFDCA